MSSLSRHWLEVGNRVWNFTAASCIACILVWSLTAAGAFSWLLPTTWLERSSSPGYVLNGSFQGTWVLDWNSQPPEPDWERLELRITEDLALLDEAHPRRFTLRRGVVARGTLTTGGRSLPFELVSDGRLFLRIDGDPGRISLVALTLEVGGPLWRDTLQLRADDVEQASTYHRASWLDLFH